MSPLINPPPKIRFLSYHNVGLGEGINGERLYCTNWIGQVIKLRREGRTSRIAYLK